MQGIAQDISNILRGFKMMVDFNKLVFAFLGIVFSIIWVLTIISLFSALKLIGINPFVLISSVLFSHGLGLSNLLNAFLTTMATIDWAEFVALIVLVIGLLIIWSVFGGAITRSAAVEFARGEKIGFKEALSFAVKKFWSYFWSPLTPIIGVLFFTACNILGGFFGQIEYIGAFAVAIGFPMAILSAFLIIFIGVIGVIGFFLMFPTISAEGSDAFDAMSRSYSYVISRPMHFTILFLGIIISGTLFTLFISCLACLVMKTSFCTVGFGMGQKFDAIKAVVSGGAGSEATLASLGSLPMKFTALMLMLYIALIKVIIGSLVVAFAGSVSTVAYFLLRKDVDGTEINDVYLEEEKEEVKENKDTKEEIKEETKVEDEKPASKKEERPTQTDETKKQAPEDPDKNPSDWPTQNE